MIYAFSTEQALNTTGDTISTRALDLLSAEGLSVADGALSVKAGDGGIVMPGGGMLQILLQSSVNGSSWTAHKALTPPLTVATLGGGQQVVEKRTPALGQARYIRLVYRVASGTVTGTITATAAELPEDRFRYQRSGFEID